MRNRSARRWATCIPPCAPICTHQWVGIDISLFMRLSRLAISNNISYFVTGGDSDSPDETVKCSTWTERAGIPARGKSSDSDSSTEEDSDEHEYETGGCDADYRTLTPHQRLDNTTLRDNDFTWMPSGDTMNDTVESNIVGSNVVDFSAASLDRRRRTPSDRSDRDRKTRSSLSAKPPQHPSSVRASPRPRRSPRNEESPLDSQRRWNSYEHFRYPEGGWWPPPMCWCHGPPVPPPCYMHERTWPSHPSLSVASRPYKVRMCLEYNV